MRQNPIPKLVALATLAACSSNTPDPEGRGLTIKVAPIDYPEVENVVYDLGVYTPIGAGYQLVWAEEDVDSQTYGNSIGDILYIGPCDASGQADGWTSACANGTDDPNCGCPNDIDCDAAGEKPGWVVIDIDSISADGDEVDASEWVNPCAAFAFGPTDDPTTADCAIEYLCEENADVLVTFNLTMMRDANQGFFDIIVEFEDVFCSAKFDTCYDDIAGTPENEAGWIQLLFRDSDVATEPARRWDTGVLAFACTGGPGADTNLYLDDVVLDCDDAGIIRLDPSQPEGGNVDAPADQDVVFGYATYFGREDLTCGDGEAGEQQLQQIGCFDTPACPAGYTCDGSQNCVPCDAAHACEAGYTCQDVGGVDLCARDVGGTPAVSCKKKYWSVAIGFDTDEDHRLSDTCTLRAAATASDGEFAGDWVTPGKTRYPVIRFDVLLTTAGDFLTCGSFGLDETEGTNVYTDYTSLDCEVDGASDFATGGLDDCDFCHRMNTTPDHPEQSARAECNAGSPPAVPPYTAICECRDASNLLIMVEDGCFPNNDCDDTECGRMCSEEGLTFDPSPRGTECRPGCVDG